MKDSADLCCAGLFLKGSVDFTASYSIKSTERVSRFVAVGRGENPPAVVAAECTSGEGGGWALAGVSL